MLRIALIAVVGLGLAGCQRVSLMPGEGPGTVANGPVSADPVTAPSPVQDPPEVRLVAAIENQGCVLTRDNVGSVLLGANMTQAELEGVMPRLVDAGRVQVAGEGQIRVVTDRCAVA